MKATSASAVFQVSDLARSLAYFHDVLGFTIEFSFREPPRYASVQRDEISIHLSCGPERAARIGQGAAYVFCDTVDDYHAEVSAKGAKIFSRSRRSHTGCATSTSATPTATPSASGIRSVERGLAVPFPK